MSENKSILQALRKNAGKTQDQVAEYMDVATNTIQNWESNPSQMKDEQLHKLLDLYDVKQEEEIKKIFWKIHKNNFKIHENRAYNFPDFLFADYSEVIETARNLELSVEEMELFGYMYHIKSNCTSTFDPNISFDDYFFEKHGGYFKTMGKMITIRNRIGPIVKNESGNYHSDSDPTDLAIMIYNYGLNHPNAPFSFCSLSKQEIIQSVHKLPCNMTNIVELYDKCKLLKDPVMIGTTSQKSFDRLNIKIEKIVDTVGHGGYYGYNAPYEYELKNIDGIYHSCIFIEKREFTNESYLKEKAEYETALARYHECPSLYDHAPNNFTPQYEFWLSLTDLGKQFVEWVEEETRK